MVRRRTLERDSVARSEVEPSALSLSRFDSLEHSRELIGSRNEAGELSFDNGGLDASREDRRATARDQRGRCGEDNHP